MIFKESRLKAEQAAIANLDENDSHHNDANNYKELMGLSYSNNSVNLIPNRFKWGKSLIRVVD